MGEGEVRFPQHVPSKAHSYGVPSPAPDLESGPLPVTAQPCVIVRMVFIPAAPGGPDCAGPCPQRDTVETDKPGGGAGHSWGAEGILWGCSNTAVVWTLPTAGFLHRCGTSTPGRGAR